MVPMAARMAVAIQRAQVEKCCIGSPQEGDNSAAGAMLPSRNFYDFVGCKNDPTFFLARKGTSGQLSQFKLGRPGFRSPMCR